jgi:hypothetical protein
VAISRRIRKEATVSAWNIAVFIVAILSLAATHIKDNIAAIIEQVITLPIGFRMKI